MSNDSIFQWDQDTIIKMITGPDHIYHNNDKVVITHAGVFHTDELMGIALLLLGPLKHEPLVHVCRSRFIDWKIGDLYILDVGRVYDPSNNMFDHHHSDFDICYPDSTLYATAGLVWMKYGESIIHNLLHEFYPGHDIDQDLTLSVYNNVETLLKEFDNIDNGQFTNTRKDSINSVLSAMNTKFTLPEPENYPYGDDDFISALRTAFTWLRSKIITDIVNYIVTPQYFECISIYENKEYVVFPTYVPWKKLYAAHRGSLDNFRVVIDESIGGKSAVHVLRDTRQGWGELKCHVPKELRDLNGDELYQRTGISDLSYSHKGGHLLLANNRASAVAVTEYLLSLNTSYKRSA